MNKPENFRTLQQRLLQPERKHNRILKSILPVLGTILAMSALAYLGWNAYQENVNGPVDLTKIPVVKADEKPYKIEAQKDSEEAASHEKKVYEAIATGKAEADTTTQDSGINVVTQGTEQMIDRSNLKPEETTIVEAKPVAEAVKPEMQGVATASAQENKVQDNRLPDDDTDTEKTAQTSATAPAAEVKKSSENVVATPVAEAKKSEEKKPNAEKSTESSKKSEAKKIPANAIKIQLGAYKSGDEAKQDWVRISRKYAQYLGDMKPIIEKADIKNKGAFYRLQAGPVKSESAAREICRKLLAVKQGCFNVTPK